MIYSFTSEAMPARLAVGGPRDQRGGRFSPDGRWFVYSSNETGRAEIYVQPYPELDRKYPVSVDGGIDPAWSRDSETIFYLSDGVMMAADITAEPEFSAGTPRELFRGQYEIDPWEDQSYGVFPDGDFAMIQRKPGSLRMRVITNFAASLPQ